MPQTVSSDSSAEMALITAEQEAEMLHQVERMEKVATERRAGLRDLKKGTVAYQQLRDELRESKRQTSEYRKQLAYLVSGTATKEDERAFTAMICKWIEENRKRHEAEMERWSRDLIGDDMVVVMPDGSKAPAWHFWLAQVKTDDPASKQLTNETHRIAQLYKEHAPQITPSELYPRSFRGALRSFGLTTEGIVFDKQDMTILMIANGLTTDEFEVIDGEEGPGVKIGAEAMRRLGTPLGMSTTIN